MKGARFRTTGGGQLNLPEGGFGLGNDGVWYVRPPGCHMGPLREHQVTEHPDLSISVSPSILVEENGQVVFHGYLEHGVWRSV